MHSRSPRCRSGDTRTATGHRRVVARTMANTPRLAHASDISAPRASTCLRHISARPRSCSGETRHRAYRSPTRTRATSWRHHVEWRYRRHDTLSQPSHRGTRQHDMWREARLKHHVEETIMSTSACRCAWTAHGSTTTRHSARAHCGHQHRFISAPSFRGNSNSHTAFVARKRANACIHKHLNRP